MITDNELWFSDGQDIGQVAGSYDSTNVFDRLNANGDAGVGARKGEIEFRVDEAVTSGGSATIDLQIVQADNAALSTNDEVLASTGAVGYAAFVSGYKKRLAIPEGWTRRYLGVRYVIAAATTTAGTIDAYYADSNDNADQAYFGNNG